MTQQTNGELLYNNRGANPEFQFPSWSELAAESREVWERKAAENMKSAAGQQFMRTLQASLGVIETSHAAQREGNGGQG